MADLNQMLYQYYYSTHKNDSDSDLQMLVLNNARMAMALPATSASVPKLEQLKTESEACNAILAERKADADNKKNAKVLWENSLSSRRNAAFLNLPVAATSLGQLVAAILEDEDGKTAEEIQNWCDELEALDDSEFNALMNSLVAEGILTKRENRFYLENICSATLFPEDAYEWGVKKLGDLATGLDRMSYIFPLWAIYEENAPLSYSDIKTVVASNRHILQAEGLCTEEDIAYYLAEDEEPSLRGYRDDDLKYCLSDMVHRRILTDIGNEVYYFPMLGERAGDQS